jgi:cyanobactin maturation PatA/PatG family protease
MVGVLNVAEAQNLIVKRAMLQVQPEAKNPSATEESLTTEGLQSGVTIIPRVALKGDGPFMTDISDLTEIEQSFMQEKIRPEPAQVIPAQNNAPSLVFALGKIGYDLVSEARRDSLMQHMNGDPSNVAALLNYLEQDPSQAASLLWTLNLEATTIYAIRPGGAFAHLGYERLRAFLRQQIEEGVERVSIPGVIAGKAQLMSGQVVPLIIPELRGMYSWTTAALIKAIGGAPPAKTAKAEERQTYDQKASRVAGFLERVYFSMQNLGLAPQDRAINYAATNALNVEKIFEAALIENLELDSIEVEASSVCRPDSQCWDVKLTFFNPQRILEQARRVYRFTVDVSDTCPVMVGSVRSWSVR